jgi:hypothetical protein
VHWYVFEDSCQPGVDDGVWRRSELIPSADWPGIRRPSAADALLHACVHGARWTRTPGIRWVTDAHRIIASGRVDWSLVVAEARRRGYTVRLRSTLRYMRVALDAPVPTEVEQELDATRPGLVERLEHAALGHEQRRLGALPSYFFAFHRARRTEMPLAMLDFPRYLAAAWEVGSPTALLSAALERGRARISGEATRQ